MFDYLIPVGQKHIDNGNCGDEYNCALALAADEARPGSESLVDSEEVSIWIEGHGRQEYGNTVRLGAWIGRFDNDKTRVSPIIVKLMRTATGVFVADILEQEEE